MMKTRSMLPVIARSRNAGAMHDRRAPRGGTRNVQRDLLDEYQADMEASEVFEVEVIPPSCGFPCDDLTHTGKNICWTVADEREYQARGGFDPFDD